MLINNNNNNNNNSKAPYETLAAVELVVKGTGQTEKF